MFFVFLFGFYECLNVVHYMENNKICLEMVEFWATETTKITRILCFSGNADVKKGFWKTTCLL